MKRRVYGLLLIIPFCILSAGCLEGINDYFFGDRITDPAGSFCDSPAAEIGYLSSGSIDRDHCYQQVAVTFGNTYLCNRIERDPPMTKCYMLIAAKQNNPAVCDQVPPTNDSQAYLKTDCLWQVAMQNNNNAACEALGNQKISRMFIGEMSRQSCLARLAGGQAATGRLT
jgi:hypothetical protein